MEGANDRSKYMRFVISGNGMAFDSRQCDIISPIKSGQTTTSKGDMSYLHEGKKKSFPQRERERQTDRQREREREFAKLVRFCMARPF